MKKILLLIIFGLGCCLSLWAQPSIIIQDAAPEVGQDFCVPVTVKNFTLITELNFTIQFDASSVAFKNVTNINPKLTGLVQGTGANTIDNSRKDEGLLLLRWNEGGPGVACTAPTVDGVTLADGEVLFELCFSNNMPYAGSSTIMVGNEPVPILITRKFSAGSCQNITLIAEEGTISSGVRPLVFSVSDATGNVGDLVCVDVQVDQGWDQLTGFQYSLNWDTTVLRLENIQPNDEIPLNSLGLFGIRPTSLAASWLYNEAEGPVDVPDSTVFFTACFRIIGDCEKGTNIEFTDNPTTIEVGNGVAINVPLPFIGEPGRVDAGPCAPTGLKVIANCGGAPVNLNDEVCIKIQAGDNFQQVREMSYLISWNKNILRYKRVQAFNGNLAMNAGDFVTNNVQNGILQVNYASMPLPQATLPAGAVAYEVCFDVIGLGGNSPIQISGPASVITSASPNPIGINPTNCEVQVNQPDGVVLAIGQGEAPVGETGCFPIRISNAQGLTKLEFSINFDPALFTYANHQNLVLPGANISAFGTNGTVTFNWTGAAQALTDETVLVELCLTGAAGATPGDCAEVSIEAFPVPTRAETDASNGENIGIDFTPGEMCVLFPDGFGVIAENTTGLRADTVCMPFKVASFDNILSAEFAVDWDPSALVFVSAAAVNGIQGLTFNTANAGVGLLGVQYNTATAQPQADSTVLFEVCFTTIGEPGGCYPVGLDSNASPETTTTTGDGSILYTPGELCIEDRFVIDWELSEIVPPSCPGACNGSVKLVVSGGRAPLGTTWRTNPVQFTALQARNLCEGWVVFTLFDNSNPGLFYTDSVYLEADTTNLPVANAGQDKTLGCGTNAIVLLSSAGSQAESLKWYRILNNGQRDATGLTGDSPFAKEPGDYIIVAQNANGCSAIDTVKVQPPMLPTALAGQDVSITCEPDSIQLNSTGSSSGANFSYQWVYYLGGVAQDTIGTTASAMAGSPGRYELRVINRQTTCVASDTVEVLDNRIFPTAVAGADQEQNCDGTPLTLDGSGSSNDELTVTYAWYDSDGNLLSSNVTAQAGELGAYTLVVKESTTGCESSATTSILPNTNAPEVLAGSDLTLNCLQDTVTLTATVTSTSSNLEIRWTALDGGQIVPGDETLTSARVMAPGLYQVEGRDLTNNCSALDTVLVIDQTIAPLVEAGADTTLDCSTNSVMLIGTGTQGDTMAYQWFKDGVEVTNGGALTLEVQDPGVYYLHVTNNNTGCVGIDSVMVGLSEDAPLIQLDTLVEGLTCTNQELTITAGVMPGTADYTINWTAADGGVISGPANGLSVTVTQAGIYRMTVKNNTNGCEAAAETRVSGEGLDLPLVQLAADTVDITCTQNTVTLDATGSSSGPEYLYTWSAVEGGETPATPDQPTLSISTPGLYRLSVRNTSTNCENTATVLVRDLSQGPAIDTLPVQAIDCINSQATLAINVPNGGSGLSITWQGLNGEVVNPATGPTTTVQSGGNYEVVVVDDATGCTSRDTIVVSSSVELPQIAFADPGAFSCTTPSLTLDASLTGTAANFSNITWSSADGHAITPATGSLVVSVNGPGTYTLTVTGLNGCEASQEIIVEADQNTPIADAGGDVEVECGETLMLGGLGSSQGPGISYQWSTVSGATLGGDLTSLNPTTTGAGTYLLVVTNATNGCTASDTVTISQITPDEAVAGNDLSTCADSLTLAGNLPAGSTGAWTTTSGAVISAPTGVQTSVSGLVGGANVFTWTLSAPGCPDYSSASVTITREMAPQANADEIKIPGNSREGSINLVVNDQLNGITDYRIELLTQPNFGRVDSITNNMLRYSVGAGVNGETTVTYRLCSTACPDLCSEASVRIVVDDDGREPMLPNTITLNGDGVNDELVFDVLLNNPPDKFPDNELIIFNRWGDIVYQAKPYANNWIGENEVGELLPEGTYYYILRLNIGEGEIIRGDITILR